MLSLSLVSFFILGIALFGMIGLFNIASLVLERAGKCESSCTFGIKIGWSLLVIAFILAAMEPGVGCMFSLGAGVLLSHVIIAFRKDFLLKFFSELLNASLKRPTAE